MSEGEPEELVATVVEDDSFIWQDYLEVTNSVEVPCDLFSHVEQSLLNGLEEGMVLEVPLKDTDAFWLASIVMACGPLLRMRYVGESEDRKHEFWCDLTKVVAHPVGWCASQGKKLTLPTELQDKIMDYESLVEKVMQDVKPAPAELLSGEGLTPVDRIKKGMKLEVQDYQHPHHLWTAMIVENVGGRLLLQYDSINSAPPNFWVFYSSPRIFELGWAAEKGRPWCLEWPSSMKMISGVEEKNDIIEKNKDSKSTCALPPDLIQETEVPSSHEFKVGMKLEAVHPINMTQLCPATIVKVFDSQYFLVQIDSFEQEESESLLSWVCTKQNPYIFPVGWTKSQDLDLKLSVPSGWTKPFNWSDYLTETNSIPAPSSCFYKNPTRASELGFELGMKLEAVNPMNHHEICVATVNKMSGHLLWICLESYESTHPCHIVSCDSMEIFPVGWCEGNSHPLTPPRFYQIPAKVSSDTERGDVKEGSNSSSPPPPQRSSWCPKIFFNHKCFSGPFLSKSKLALLPKSVGPGPVTLVMHEVLSMLISVAYVSSRVLRVLQVDGDTERGSHLEVFKAKKNDHVYRANIAVVTSADKVPTFCRSVCQRLQVCPHLFGPTEISVNNCPEKCHTLSKTRFNSVPYTAAGANVSNISESTGDQAVTTPRLNKAKRRRKKIYKTKVYERALQARLARQQNTNSKPPITDEDFASLLLLAEVIPGSNSSDQAGTGANVPAPVVATNSSINSASGIKRKYKKRVIPHSDIQTRGAKLPKYSKQWMRKGGWKRQEKLKGSTLPTKRLSEDPSDNSSQDAPRIKRKYTRRNPVAVKPMKLPKYAHAIRLQSNPLHWSVKDLCNFLATTKDCRHVASICRQELIDGHSFMLLNFPTIQEGLQLKLDEALNLCRLVQEVKLAFHIQYIINVEP